MRKIYLAAILLVSFLSCRRDRSAFVQPKIATTNEKCLLVSSVSDDGKESTTNTYTLDSIITESIVISDGQLEHAWYLDIENPKQFIFMDGARSPENAVSRLYLNEFGSIAKEVAVTLNADGKTYTESADEVNTFTYNAKKQLIKADTKIGDEKALYSLDYDTRGRVQRIIGIDQTTGTEALLYDNFTFSSQPKSDNSMSMVVVVKSPSSFFMPSLRNAYLTGFSLKGSLLSATISGTVGINYTFSQGKLKSVITKISALGQTQSFKETVTLSCK